MRLLFALFLSTQHLLRLRVRTTITTIARIPSSSSSSSLLLRHAQSKQPFSTTSQTTTSQSKTTTTGTTSHHHRDCVVHVTPGAGGADAVDWAQMMSRMYTRFLNRHGFKVVNSPSRGNAIVLEVKGKGAYGLLHDEKGAHRLVRSSPFNAQGKRHTSFAAVEVWPVLPPGQSKNTLLDESEVEITAMRSSGPGGQNVNKVESAVRIRHLATNLVVRASSERSQAMNKKEAMRLLSDKVNELRQQQAHSDFKEIKGDSVNASFGEHVRSYVMTPYQQVKDNRSGVTTTQVERVLDGDLDDFLPHVKTIKQQ